MPALPASSSFTGSTVTEAQFKQAITDQREFLASLLGADGAIATALATMGALVSGVLTKTAAYTVVTADRGRLIDCSGTWTLSLSAAASLGSGFAFAVCNSGSGTITIDPYASETIDGSSTITLAPGISCLCVSTGTTWRIFGKTPIVEPTTLFEAAAATLTTAGTVNTPISVTGSQPSTAWTQRALYSFNGKSGSAVNLYAKTQIGRYNYGKGYYTCYGYARVLINGVEKVAVSTNSGSYLTNYLYSAPVAVTLNTGDVIELQTRSQYSPYYANSGGIEIRIAESAGIGSLLFLRTA
jgi:hypothetical protein